MDRADRSMLQKHRFQIYRMKVNIRVSTKHRHFQNKLKGVLVTYTLRNEKGAGSLWNMNFNAVGKK